MISKETYEALMQELSASNTTLVAVSKTKPPGAIRELYDLGHRDFGENYVQELQEKYEQLPKDIRWHFIGHLQSNKVKFIVPFIQLIQGVDSLKLLKEIGKQAGKVNRTIDCLLQVHIASEETKFGMDEAELENALGEKVENVNIRGLMGMASFTDDHLQVKKEFAFLKGLFDRYRGRGMDILSMGMSGDYKTAIAEGSNMVRIGSILFGSRQ